MKKDNFILIGILSIIVVIAVVCGVLAFQNSQKQEVKSDAKKIQEEYAEYNGEVNQSNKKNYPIVNLSDDNPFQYKTEEEVVKILESGTAILYFGFPTCPWCRTMLPVLEEAAKEENIGEIIYLNIKDIRSSMELDENDKIVTTRKGTDDYYKILDLLKDYLSDYTFKGKDGKIIETGEKRLYAPTVVAVSKGKIVSVHEGTIESQKEGYDPLEEDQKKELKEIFKKIVTSISFDTCDPEGC